MKKTLIYIAFFSIFWACKKEETFDEFGFLGEGQALVNGVEWKAKAGATSAISTVYCQDTCLIGIVLENLDSDGILRSKIVLNFFEKEEGRTICNYVKPTWTRAKNKITYYAQSDDVFTGAYYITKKDSSNFLEITKLDEKTWDIEGNFEATVVRDSLFTPKGFAPDTIKIRNGFFRSRVKWR
jgi:hypothetical protein